MKGSCVVTGRGVVLTLTAEEEGPGWSKDVAVTEWKVKQRIVKFRAFYENFPNTIRGLPKESFQRDQLHFISYRMTVDLLILMWLG